ncbi:hypothetical protein H0A70_18265 [Alcaligenaceae bacterium]|nr:hypothetical protein [Alcaligenaceae bacterium]
MKRLHILFQHGEDRQPFGCSMIRLVLPLARDHASWHVTQGTDLPPSGADVVVVERLWKPDTDIQRAEALVRQLNASGTRIIYTLDDDLLALDMPPKRANAVRLFAREADGILVSTPTLLERMRALNDNVLLLPNHIDDALFGPPREPKAPSDIVTMGYMGTYTHLPDLLGILAPLRRSLRRHDGKLRLEMVGVSDNPQVLELFKGLPVTLRRADGHVRYDRFVPWMKRELDWDFALAPLADTNFNISKSDLKYLDYGALTIPAIFSDVRPYRDTVVHGVTGLVARSDEEWETHIDTMTGGTTLRHELASAARDQVYAERSLAIHSTDWFNAIEQIIGHS